MNFFRHTDERNSHLCTEIEKLAETQLAASHIRTSAVYEVITSPQEKRHAGFEANLT